MLGIILAVVGVMAAGVAGLVIGVCIGVHNTTNYN